MTTPALHPALDTRGLGSVRSYDLAPVHRLFECQAIRTPDATAVVHHDASWTYRELDEAADAVARLLAARDVRPGQVVALKLERGMPLIASLIGCLKAGCVYLPIDPHFPDMRIDFMIADAVPAAIIVDDDAVAAWSGRVPRVLCPADAAHAPASAAEGRASKHDPDSPIYIIYTSGTTGRPKGIVQRHRTISNLIAWQNATSGIAFGGRVLQYSSLSFDVHLQEMFSAFSCGGSICLLDQADRLDPRRLLDVVQQRRVSVLFLPVAVLNSISEVLRDLPDSVTDIITAGEQLVITPTLERILTGRPSLRLHNHYGVSESHVVTALTLTGGGALETHPSIGMPISNTIVSILGADGRPAGTGEIGEIWIAGDCLAEGYLNLPDRTAETFLVLDGRIWYRTGDFAMWRADGTVAFSGRKDDQVKINGQLVRLGEVEAALASHPAILQCAVVANDVGGERRLIAHVSANALVSTHDLRRHVACRLPDAMIPSLFILADRLPVGATGKVDRAALAAPKIDRSLFQAPYAPPDGLLEQAVIDALTGALGLTGVGMDDDFAAVGVTSLTTVRAAAALTQALDRDVSPLLFFECATPRQLAAMLTRNAGAGHRPAARPASGNVPIAVIGAVGLFPGADGIDDLWQGIMQGVEMLSDAPDGDGAGSPLLPTRGERVPKHGPIRDAERFDAALFGISNQDALWMDPQQRKLLEMAWACLEDAGIDPARSGARIGVFAGTAESAYLFNTQSRIETAVDYLAAIIGSDKDFVASRVSYHLGLTGPAVNVQSACSTGLLAVHEAVRAILAGDCDMALAGAASIVLPQDRSLPYVPEAILSPDGETRPFDIRRSGTNLTNAVAMVCLKTLETALADGDPIRGVIRATAANNDGHRKTGFAAPSVPGQRDAILDALARSGVDPAAVAFVETHGTATELGDRVELKALEEAYGQSSVRPCYLTSVKSWVGHTNRAAGLVGLIAAMQALRHRTIPPVKHFTAPAPELGLDRTRFRVATRPVDLDYVQGLACAGVSSFGVGGTNLHAVLESCPAELAQPQDDGTAHLFLISGRTPSALETLARKHARHLGRQPERLRDIAKTLAEGRRALAVRGWCVARTLPELISELDALAAQPKRAETAKPLKTAFLVPGMGVEHAAMGRTLFSRNAVFRHVVSEGSSLLRARSGIDLQRWFTGDAQGIDLGKNAHAHPLLLLCEVGVARALTEMGARPDVMLGLSGGEFACAVLAGSIDFDSALHVVHERGRLMDEMAIPGAAATVFLPREKAEAYLVEGTFFAGANSRRHTLLAGRVDSMARLLVGLDRDEVEYKVLSNRVPNHTPLMAPVGEALRAVVSAVDLRPPRIPFLSSATGRSITDEQVTDPGYWAWHLCAPIRFADGIDTLDRMGCNLFIEAGPRDTACQLARAHLPGRTDLSFAPALAADDEERSFAAALGEFWARGGALEREKLIPGTTGRRVHLPAYPFEGERYWMERTTIAPAPAPAPAPSFPTILPREQWLNLYALRPVLPAMPAEAEMLDGIGAGWAIVGGGGAVEPFAALLGKAGLPLRLLTWREAETAVMPPNVVAFGGPDDREERLLAGARILTRVAGLSTAPERRVCFVTLSDAAGPDRPDAAFATLAQTASLEMPDVACRHVLIDRDAQARDWATLLVDELADSAEAGRPVVVLAGRRRYVEAFEPASDMAFDADLDLLEDGVYVLIGGSGVVGRKLCDAMARRGPVRLAIVGRTPLYGTTPASAAIRAQIDALRDRAQVMYFQADAGNAEQLVGVFREVVQTWGRMDAILHMAANIESDRFLCFLPDLTVERVEDQLRPKIGVLAAVDRALEEAAVPPGSTVKIAFSSVSVLLSGLGYAAYTYANRRLADMCSDLSRGWCIVHWDVWGSGGDRPQETIALGSSFTGLEIPGDIGLGLLRQIVAAGLGEAAIVIMDPQARLHRAAERGRTDAGSGSRPSGTLDTASESLMDRVRRIWEDRLAVAPIPNDADFLAYGGDSLAAIQVALDLRRALDIPVTPAVMMRNPRLSDFIRALSNMIGQGDGMPVVDGAATDSTFLASPLQQRWFLMHRFGFGNLLMPVLLTGAIDMATLERSANAALSRFDALRMVYEERDGKVFARVLDRGRSPRVRVIDVSGMEPQAQREWLAGWATDLELRVLPLVQHPPVEAYILRCAADKTLFVVHTCHICFDGWSASLLLDSIGSHYRGDQSDARAPSFAHSAAWAWRYLASDGAEALRGQWRRHLAGAPAPVRPTPDLAEDSDDLTGRKCFFNLSAETAKALRNVGRQHGGTLFTALMAAFAVFLKRSSGGTCDLLFGTTGAGRSAPEADDVLGVFVNPLPVRVRVDGDETLAGLFATLLDAQELFQSSQSYPITDLIEAVPAVGVRGLNGVFTSYLLYQNYRQPEEWPDCHVDFGEPDDESDHPILSAFTSHQATLMRHFEVIVFNRQDGSLSVNVWYRCALYSKDRIAILCQLLQDILHSLASGGTEHEFLLPHDLQTN